MSCVRQQNNLYLTAVAVLSIVCFIFATDNQYCRHNSAFTICTLGKTFNGFQNCAECSPLARFSYSHLSSTASAHGQPLLDFTYQVTISELSGDHNLSWFLLNICLCFNIAISLSQWFFQKFYCTFHKRALDVDLIYLFTASLGSCSMYTFFWP